MSGRGAAVQVNNLSFSYMHDKNRVEALNNVSFSVTEGEIYALIGPSGCGKSTLLYILAGLIPCEKSCVLTGGENPRPGRRETSLILQNYGLLPWKTVWDNVILGLEIRRLPAPEIRTKGEKALQEMGLQQLKSRYPAELSGGQRQRVAIARSLITEPDLLLMDEPFSSLDALTRETMQDVLQNILLTRGLTVLLVTHSIEEAAFLGRRIIVLTAHPASVYRIFENHEADTPGYRKSAAFFRLCTELREAMESVKDG